MTRAQRVALVYPLLLAVTPILHLAAENFDQILPNVTYVPLAVSLIATLVVYAGLWLVCRNIRRAAVLTCLLIAAFASYGHVHDQLFEQAWFATKLSLSMVLSTFYLVGLGSLVWYVGRAPAANLEWISQLFCVASMVLFAICIRECYRELKDATYHPKHWAVRLPQWSDTRGMDLVDVPPDASPELPDIYYIILDGYARDDTLQQVYGYDNHSFTDSLRERGFYIADRSYSNYSMTFLSLSSSLNMNYINSLIEHAKKSNFNRHLFFRRIQHNRVEKYLQKQGYRIVHCASNYDGTSYSDHAEIQYSASSPMLRSEFASALLKSTALREFAPSVAKTHLHALETLHNMPKVAGPKFTFAHILMPHNPYVFDRHGNIQVDVALDLQFGTKTGGWQNQQGYLEQLQFLNTQMQSIVDTLISQSSRPPVIIIQADHGSASTGHSGDEDEFCRERMAILNAYYGPPEFLARLYPEITPVNTFRTLLATLFDAPLKPLPDRKFFAWYDQPLELREVTKFLEAAPQVDETPVAPPLIERLAN